MKIKDQNKILENQKRRDAKYGNNIKIKEAINLTYQMAQTK